MTANFLHETSASYTGALFKSAIADMLQSIWETTRSYMQVIQHHIQEVELRFQTMQDTEES